MDSSMKFLQARPLFSANAAFRATGSLFFLIAPLVFCSDLSSESAFKAPAKPKTIHKKSKKRSQLPRNPTTLTMSPDNTYAYVSYEGSHTIHKVDPVTFVGYESIELQKVPCKYVLDAACTTLCVIYENSNEISLIDLATGKVKYSFLLDPHPKSMALSADASTIHVMQEYCDYMLSIDCKSGQLAKSPLNEEELFHSITHKIKDIQLSPDEKKAYISYENSEETSCVELAALVVKPPKEPEYPFLSAIFDPLEEIIDFFTVDLTPAKQQPVEEACSTTSESSTSSSIAQLPETFASEYNSEDVKKVTEEVIQEVIETEPQTPVEEIIVCNLTPIEPPLEIVDVDVPEEAPVAISTPIVAETTKPLTIIAPKPVAISAPKIAYLATAKGPTTGGTAVRLIGSDFTKTTSVKFGAKDAAQFTVDSATVITAIAPAGSGTVDVTVTANSATSTPCEVSKFTYEENPSVLQTSSSDIAKTPTVNTPATKPVTVRAPKIAHLATAKGPTTGGTIVKITGAGFTNATAVKFGAKDATEFTVHSATLITAVAPAGSGTVDVTVTSSLASSTPNTVSQFTYETLPIVLKLSRERGSPKGGNNVEIRGYHFNDVTDVKFGDASAISFKVVSPTMIKAVSPKGSGTVDVTVITKTGPSAANTLKYTYQKKSKTKKVQKKNKK